MMAMIRQARARARHGSADPWRSDIATPCRQRGPDRDATDVDGDASLQDAGLVSFT